MVDVRQFVPLDTSFEAAEVQWEIVRRMLPEKKLELATQLSESCRLRLAEGVRQRHPEYDARRVQLAVIRLLLPEDLYRAAYPDAQEVLP